MVSPADAVLREAEVRENIGDPDFRSVRLVRRFKPEHMFKHLGDARFLFPPEPSLDRCLPDIDLETHRLFDGGECLQFERLQPPLGSALVACDRFGPELITITLDIVTVDHAIAGDRPNPSRAGWVFQISAGDGIDGTGEHTLPGQVDRMLAVGRTEAIGAPREKRLDRG